MYKQNKYRNKITELDGIKFHSRKEAARHSELKLLEKSGSIKDLRLQVPYQLIQSLVINGKRHRPILYYADFVYIQCIDNKEVVEDVKGMQTDIFKIKYRLMKQIYDIDIKIT